MFLFFVVVVGNLKPTVDNDTYRQALSSTNHRSNDSYA